ncbi:birA, biotin-(acetyl-CoA-carboxylase) ligase [Burkholderiales bacterium JOSHI_001]|nr:birA, biotin-(acetyl-CoA-carboxylase) ligase [Burkholderiales bacterium JOSHI_001]
MLQHTSNHLSWDAQALWQLLSPRLPGLEVQVLAEVGSTNTLLMERARHLGPAAPSGRGADQPGRRADDTAPTLLVAEAQTQGRGRQGRSWQAAAGASLTFSLSLRLAPSDWSGLSLAVGLALADALDPWPADAADHRPRIGLKWPNDLLLMDDQGGGRKLAGTLIETVGAGSARRVVVGVGINVLPLPLRDLSQGYACLHEMDHAASAPQTLLRVALPLVCALQQFEAEGFAGLVPLYARRDALAGQPVRTTLAGLPEGVAEGVDPDGALRVRAGSTVQRVSAGDVSVRLQGEATGPGPLEPR